MPAPTAEEQFYLELINEARLDPVGSAARYITSYSPLTSNYANIQVALDFFGVNGTALRQAFAALTAVGPVAWNDALATAAEKHSAAMIATDTQAHQVAGEQDIGGRVTAEGYNWNALGENVYAYSDSTIYGHAGFMVDWGNGPNGMQSPAGHRENIVNGAFREVGIDVTNDSSAATTVGPQVVTQDFGVRAGAYFVLGVAYTDSNADGFYTVGEGLGGLTVQAGASSVASAASGGYSLGLATGAHTITFTGGGLTGPLVVKTTIGNENIKLDVVGGNTLLSSGSVVVASGTIAVLRGLGVRGLSLTAGAGNQTVEGNAGNDTLTGGAGNDTLIGHAGSDIAVFSGVRADYVVTKEGQNFRLVDQRGGSPDGNDLTLGIEQYQFADGMVLAANLVTVTNTVPVAQGDVATTAEDTAVTVTVLANDSDTNGDSLSVTAVGDPPHGTAVVNGNGTITYTPDGNYNGQDSFSYTISDGKGGSDTATVNVTISAVNDAPVLASALPDQALTEGAAWNFQVAGGTFTDPDSPLSYSAMLSSGSALPGWLSFNGVTRTFSGTPPLGSSGAVEVKVIASDGALTASDMFTLTITGQNNAPVITSNGGGDTAAVGVAEGNLAVATVAATDAAASPLTYSIAGGADASKFAINAQTGALSFLQAPDFEAPADTNHDNVYDVTVLVSDGALTDSQQLAVSVTNVGFATARLNAPTGFIGSAGGTANVVGTTGFQDLTIVDVPGELFLLGFGLGNDVLRFSGSASRYGVTKSANNLTISDGDTTVVFALSPQTTYLEFADGIRTARFENGNVMVGSQVVTTNSQAITAGATAGAAPGLGDPDVIGRLFPAEAGPHVVAGGRLVVGGTSEAEVLEIDSGVVNLLAGFSSGTDRLHFSDLSIDYTARRSGGHVVIERPGTEIYVLGTPAGIILDFPDGEQLLSLSDIANYVLTIGDQVVTNTAQRLSPNTQILSLDQGSVGAPAAINAGTGTFVFEDSAAAATNVRLSNFGADDIIRVTGATAASFTFAKADADNDGTADDLLISRVGHTHQIAILDQLSAADTITGLASAQAATGMQLMTFA